MPERGGWRRGRDQAHRQGRRFRRGVKTRRVGGRQRRTRDEDGDEDAGEQVRAAVEQGHGGKKTEDRLKTAGRRVSTSQ